MASLCALMSGTAGASVLLLLLSNGLCSPLGPQPERLRGGNGAVCGYQSCDLGNPDMLNVHLVAHSHDDLGWLKTADQYFYGGAKKIAPGEVRNILDTVMKALEEDTRRKFIYAEMAFFERWWRIQDDETMQLVRKLVNEGRLEFTLGGWVMNDEGTTHYSAIIDQHSLGFKFLNDTFGECGRPRTGWQIDPFGHSREYASLSAQFGFDGQFIGRLDHQDKFRRGMTKNMEEMWHGSESLSLDQAGLFTGVNFDLYVAPDGFCFDSFSQSCTDSPMIDDKESDEYNIPQKVADFIRYANHQSKYYTTNHIMVTMGGDFQYEYAHSNFRELDKLIKYVNEQQTKNNSRINLIYSTPSCYLYALNKANQTYTTKSDDFFPLGSNPHTFWTGYFTSRPTLKGYERTTNAFLQTCKQLNAFTNNSSRQPDPRIRVLKEAVGLAQHHDAVSGTAKQAVTNDYTRQLSRGVHACQSVIQDTYKELLPLSQDSEKAEQIFCPLANVSSCPQLENLSSFTVIAYNPIGRSGVHNFRVPVTANSYTVIDSKGNIVQSQIVRISDVTRNLPEFNGSKSEAELVFQAELPPLGFSTYFVTNTNKKVHPSPFIMTGNDDKKPHTRNTASKDFIIENEFTRLKFDSDTGLLESLTNKDKSISVNLSQQILFYKGYKGTNFPSEFRSSGAYIFRPNGTDAERITEQVSVDVVKGPVVQEVRQVFSSWASQVIRLYAGKKEVEVEWTIGPIPVDDNIGKEVISRYVTNIASNGTFYTDSNGREMLERRRDYRQTWSLEQTEPIAGNYYPVNSRIYIRDEDASKPARAQLTVMTDRSEGGSSIRDGEIELMMHRRLLVDDAFGVQEPLNETGTKGKGLIARGSHYLLLESVSDAARGHRDISQRLFMTPVVTFSKNFLPPDEYSRQYHPSWSAVLNELPDNVNLLTLEAQGNRTYLVRLEHFYAKGEDKELSKAASVDIVNLFKNRQVLGITELTLGANQLLSEAQRLSWNVEGRGRTNGNMQDFVSPVTKHNGSLTITLKPMQIRTFRLILQ